MIKMEENKVSTWAKVDSKTNLVADIVLWDGVTQVDFGEGFDLYEVPDGTPISTGYTYAKGKYIEPPLTEKEQADKDQNATSSNVATKQVMMNEVNIQLSILQDAVDLEMATDEEKASLPLWKKYRVLLSRIDANTKDDIKWPQRPS